MPQIAAQRMPNAKPRNQLPYFSTLYCFLKQIVGTMQSPLLEIVHRSGPNQIVIAQTWDESVRLNEGPRLRAARRIHNSYQEASCPLFSECHNVRL